MFIIFIRMAKLKYYFIHLGKAAKAIRSILHYPCLILKNPSSPQYLPQELAHIQ